MRQAERDRWHTAWANASAEAASSAADEQTRRESAGAQRAELQEEVSELQGRLGEMECALTKRAQEELRMEREDSPMVQVSGRIELSIGDRFWLGGATCLRFFG